MVEVQMSDDIRKIETKLAGPLNKREFLGCVIGGAIFLALAVILPISDIVIRLFIALLVASPFIMSGWLTLYKQPFEVFLTRFIVYRFIIPPARKAVRKNDYKEDYIKIKKKREAKKMSKMTPKQKKEYLNKAVSYSSKPKYKIYT